MGGVNSTRINQQSLMNAVSSAVVQSMQSTSSTSEALQRFDVNCENWQRIVTGAFEKCYEKYDKNVELISLVCIPLQPINFPCGGTNVTFSQNIEITSNDTQIQNMQTDLEQSLAAKLTTQLQDITGLLQFGNSVKADVQAITNAVQSVSVKVFQEALTASDLKQIIELKGGQLNIVNATQGTKIISTVLQQNTTVVKAVQQLSNDLTAEVKQNSMAEIWKWIGIGLGILVALALLIYLIIFFAKRNAKRAASSRGNDTIELQIVKKKN